MSSCPGSALIFTPFCVQNATVTRAGAAAAPGSLLAGEAAATRTHRALGSTTRARLLALLRAAPEPRSIGELAAALGLHPNSVRDQLAPLLTLGLVERRLARPVGRGRPGYRYSAGRQAGAQPLLSSDRAGEGTYRALAAALADQLAARQDRQDQAETAGERWGRGLVPGFSPATTARAGLAKLVGLLDAAGFEPDPDLGPGGTLGLHRCPFAAIIGGRNEVVCGIHLGLMRGALRGLGAPLRVERLEPFVRPDLCLAHLAVAVAADA